MLNFYGSFFYINIYRGHAYKLYKPSGVNSSRSRYFVERIVDVYNFLPSSVNFSTLDAFKRSIVPIDFSLFLKYRYNYYIIHCVPKKHVTTFLMISWSRTVRLERFLAHLLLRVQAIDGYFYFPTSPISCSYFTLGNCQDLNISKN